jgi:hypothetical protein
MINETIIAQTKKWITDVVVGLNFCPFAAREVKRASITYEVIADENPKNILEKLLDALQKMDSDKKVETTLLILTNSFDSFDHYLNLVHLSEKLLKKNSYEGIYQIASFHPRYLFAGSKENDAANYTNRSPYPMLHILREESVSLAIETHPNTNKIPEKNIAFAREKGEAFMKALRDACIKNE